MSKIRSKTKASKGKGNSQDQADSHGSENDDEQDQEPEYRGPGRPTGSTYIEDYWTRVLSPCYRQINYEAKFDIKMDLANELEALEEQEEYLDNISWPIFLPDAWAKDLGMLKMEDHKLSEEDIKAYAVEISALR